MEVVRIPCASPYKKSIHIVLYKITGRVLRIYAAAEKDRNRSAGRAEQIF